MEEKKLIVTEQEQGKRLDVYLTTALDISRSYAQQLIQRKEVTVNGKEAKANRRLNEGDQVQAVIELQEEYKVVPQDIPLDIVSEDKDIIVVNKARGMVVHPAAGNPDGTLVNALLYHCQGELSGINGVIRPGIVHRLDKDTSGVMVAAKTDEAHKGWPNRLKNIRRTGRTGPWSTAIFRKNGASSMPLSAAIPKTGSRWPSPLRVAAKL